MAIIRLDGLDSVGIHKDVPTIYVPPQGWTDGKNVSFRDGAVIKSNGYQSAVGLGIPIVTPYFIFAARDPFSGNDYAIYAGLNKVYSILSGIHQNRTRSSGAGADVDYSASVNNAWHAGTLNGILVMNNGTDVPQYLGPVSTAGARLQNLTAWTSAWSASTLRPFLNYLVALNVSKAGTRYGSLVKWSHAAGVGSIPSSWDEADASLDAGEVSLADDYGDCIDCLPLGSINLIYKEQSVWQMSYIGYPQVFSFQKLFNNFGILARGCVAEYEGQHYVLTKSDILVHNGQEAKSIASLRIRKELFGLITTQNQSRCYVAVNYAAREVWFCVPVSGTVYAERAYIYSTRNDTWTIRDLGTFNAIGLPSPTFELGSTTEVWDAAVGAWDTYSGSTWFFRLGISDVMLACASGANKLYAVNIGTSADGNAYTATVEHADLFLSPEGKPEDMARYKLVRSIRPYISSSTALSINIQLGTRMEEHSTITWSPSVQYTVGSNVVVPFNQAARFFGFRFSTNSGALWELKQYTVDFEQLGTY